MMAMSVTEQIIGIASAAVASGGVGSVATWLIARRRAASADHRTDGKVAIAKLAAEQRALEHFLARVAALESRVESRDGTIDALQHEVSQCEDERRADREACARERAQDRAEAIAAAGKLRMQIASLQEEILGSRRFKTAVREETREEVRKVQSDPSRLAYGAADSVDSGETDLDTQLMRPLPPPPPRRR